MTHYRNTFGYRFSSIIQSIEAAFYGLTEVSLDVDGLETSFYRSKDVYLDKPTIVLLHGFSADKKVWLRFSRHLGNKYNIIIPDLAGHGKTPYLQTNSHTISDQAERVVHLLQKLQIPQFHIIGNSMGGFISAHLSVHNPDNILSACLMDPAGVFPTTLSKMDYLVQEGKNPFYISSKLDFERFYKMTMAKPPFVPKFVLNSFALEYQSKINQLKHIFSEFTESKGFLGDQLDKINCPTLILWGAKDELLHVDTANIWHKEIKQSELTIWPEIGHMPMLEIAKKSAKRYQQFLTDNGIN